MAEDFPSSLSCDLPGDIMLDIVCRVPLKSLLKFKRVSKSWYSLVKNQFFIKKHYNYSSKHEKWDSLVLGRDTKYEIGVCTNMRRRPLRWEPIGVHDAENLICVGVSMGLICMTPSESNCSRHGSTFLVMNPVLRESKITHRKLLPLTKTEIFHSISLGFGYDHEHEDFKIVRIERLRNGVGFRVNIYSLYTDSWKQITCSENLEPLSHIAVALNNSLHWVDDPDVLAKEIKIFNLASERFYNIPLPEPDKSCCWWIHLQQPDSIVATMFNTVDRSAWKWIACPKEDTEVPYIWIRDVLIIPDLVKAENKRIKRKLERKFPEYQNLIQISRYKESLVPVKREDMFFLNVIQRLKDAYWIRSNDDALQKATDIARAIVLPEQLF